MSNDRFAVLAARSAQLRNEHRLVLEGLRAFQQKLVELVAGLGCGGNSHTITLDEFTDSENEVTGCVLGYLAFDGKELWVATKQERVAAYHKPVPEREMVRLVFRPHDCRRDS